MKLVLGGGLGGLSAAYYLGRAGSQAVLVERSGRLGGWVRSERDPGTGVLLELGPHTVRSTGFAGCNTLHLLGELGLGRNDLLVLAKDSAASARRFVVCDSTLHLLPSSFSSLFRKTPPFSRPLIFSVIKDLVTPKKNTKDTSSDDETAYDFIDRRFGTELAEYIISPMLCGICAGDAKEISIKSLLPPVYNAEQKYGSVIRGILFDSFSKSDITPPPQFPDVKTWSIWTHKDGLSSLIDTLRNRVTHQGSEINLSSNVTALKINKDGVSCEINGELREFSHCVSCVPASALSSLVKIEHPSLSHLLSEIPYATVAVVHLVYHGDLLKGREAFGFLVPPSENKSLLGIIYDSCIRPEDNRTVFTAMLGGRWFHKYFSHKTTPEEIQDITLSYMKTILQIEDTPETCKVSILKDCIPQYTLGHSERVNKMNNYIKDHMLPLSLVGSAYKGVGINDVILSAKQAVDHLHR